MRPIFSFACPILDAEREWFYDEYIADKEAFKKWKDMDQFAFLLLKENVKGLGIFLETMLNKRRQTSFIAN